MLELRTERWIENDTAPRQLQTMEIRATATIHRGVDSGNTVVKSAGTTGVPAENTAEVERTEREELAAVCELLEEAGIDRTLIEYTILENETKRTRTADTDAMREETLTGTLSQTRQVLQAIDKLAESGWKWSRHPKLGVRGSCRGRAPRVKVARGRNTTGRTWIGEAKWLNDGTPGCLCPLAAVQGTGRGTDDEKWAKAHNEPLQTALNEFLKTRAEEPYPATEDKAIEEAFDLEAAPWALLVLIADNSDVETWRNDELGPLTGREIELFERSRKAISDWMETRLRPARADELNEYSGTHR